MSKVEELAHAIFQGLQKDSWGDIEPDTFGNIADGFTGKEDPEDDEVLDKLYFNKISAEEMLKSVKSMRRILAKALKEIGVIS